MRERRSDIGAKATKTDVKGERGMEKRNAEKQRRGVMKERDRQRERKREKGEEGERVGEVANGEQKE